MESEGYVDVGWPKAIDFYFQGNETSLVADPAIDVKITKTGMYYLWYVICDRNLVGVTVDGMTVWKNPFGYLPGMMAPFETFYGFMALAYLAVGAVWFAQYIRYWKDILALQNCITAVIALCMLEMATWYFDFVNFNAYGVRPYATTVWAVMLGSVRKTISRMLILVVSMGYGVVRPTLGGITSKVLTLGAAYFVATCSLDVMQNVGTIDDLTSSARLFLVLPVAVLDAIFILWIFTSLSKTLAQLQVRAPLWRSPTFKDRRKLCRKRAPILCSNTCLLNLSYLCTASRSLSFELPLSFSRPSSPFPAIASFVGLVWFCMVNNASLCVVRPGSEFAEPRAVVRHLHLCRIGALCH